LPAVTLPPSRKAGLSLASFSSVVSRRGPSSASTTVSDFLVFAVTGTISSRNLFPSCAATAFSWLLRAKRSWASLETWYSSANPSGRSSSGVIWNLSWARFSAVMPNESVWPISSILGFTKRQPRVVSYMVALPVGNARSGLGTAQGARLMDSTPPPT
jgi:hypothetical protein